MPHGLSRKDAIYRGEDYATRQPRPLTSTCGDMRAIGGARQKSWVRLVRGLAWRRSSCIAQRLGRVSLPSPPGMPIPIGVEDTSSSGRGCRNENKALDPYRFHPPHCPPSYPVLEPEYSASTRCAIHGHQSPAGYMHLRQTSIRPHIRNLLAGREEAPKCSAPPYRCWLRCRHFFDLLHSPRARALNIWPSFSAFPGFFFLSFAITAVRGGGRSSSRK